jgi:hypothetical protein
VRRALRWRRADEMSSRRSDSGGWQRAKTCACLMLMLLLNLYQSMQNSFIAFVVPIIRIQQQLGSELFELYSI